MAKIETHIRDCEFLLGKGFEDIHRYLDQYAKIFNPMKYGEFHRIFLHNKEGLKEIKENFGFYAEIAAKIHLIRDCEVYILDKMMYYVRNEEIDVLCEKSLKVLEGLKNDYNKEKRDKFIRMERDNSKIMCFTRKS